MMHGSYPDYIATIGRNIFLFILGLLGFSLLFALLEQLGFSARLLTDLFLGLLAISFLVTAYLARTTRIGEFFMAGKRIPAFYAGAAGASGWLSGAVFLGGVGLFYQNGHEGLVIVAAFLLSLCFLLFFAPAIQRQQSLTVAAGLAEGRGAYSVQLLAGLASSMALLMLLVAHIGFAGFILTLLTHIPVKAAIPGLITFLMLLLILGGYRALTWLQILQYCVLMLAFLLPAAWIAAHLTGLPLPHLAAWPLYEALPALPEGFAPFALLSPDKQGAALLAGGALDGLHVAGLILCLTFGMASLPHLVLRFAATPSPQAARRSVGWFFLFLGAFLVTIPVYAIFARTELQSAFGGLLVRDLDNVAPWLWQWAVREGQTLITLCGEPASGLDAVVKACKSFDYRLGLQDLAIHPALIIIALSEATGLPAFIMAFLALGAVSAALAQAGGLYMALSNSLTHDVFHRPLQRFMPDGQTLLLARIVLIGIAYGLLHVDFGKLPALPYLFFWGLSLGGAALFPALLVRTFWPRTRSLAQFLGILTGFGLTATLIYLGTIGPDLHVGSGDEQVLTLPGLPALSAHLAGLVGVVAGLAMIWVVNLFTQPDPGQDT